MSNFSEFLKNSESHNILSPGGNGSVPQLELAKKASDSLTALAVVDPRIEKNDISDFSTQFSGLVFSDNFISELSGVIQRPHPGESEEQFVKRCKESLSLLIDKHLDAKPK